MIKTKKLSSQRSVTYGFFGSKGGVSKGIYKSLNCGVGSNDEKNNIKKNLNIVLKKLKANTKKIHLPKQIHSNKFYFIKNKSIKNRFKCDALITKQINTPIGVLTADCAPIVLFDPNKEIISVIHAGWRGALSGIVKNVTNFFIKEGSKVESLESNTRRIGQKVPSGKRAVREGLSAKTVPEPTQIAGNKRRHCIISNRA